MTLDDVLTVALLQAGADPCPACGRPLAETRIHVSGSARCACWSFATHRILVDLPDDGTTDWAVA